MEQIYFLIVLVTVVSVWGGFNYFSKPKRKEHKYALIKSFNNVFSIRHIFDNPLSPLLLSLRDIRKKDTITRDKWFEKYAEDMALDGWCLSYIDSYGHLTATFLNSLNEPEKNLTFQRLLISVRKSDIFDAYQANYENILFLYAKKWELAPEIQKVLAEDERFRVAKEIYELGRRFATK